jgi:N-methylhydantoinase A
MLGPGKLASGITLDVAAAERAIVGVASRINQTVEATAAGILQIAAAAMANAMREISVEQGLDPRDMVLLPFGGAGPMMATLLADEMNMGRIVVPPFAGIFSAWGLLGADMVQGASRTLIRPFEDGVLTAVAATMAQLLAGIRTRGETAEGAVPSLRLDIRYAGQEHTLSVPVALDGERPAETASAIAARFREDYARAFGATLNDALELTSVRVQLTNALPQRELTAPLAVKVGDDLPEIEAWSFARALRMPFRIVPRNGLGDGLQGPAIVTEDVTTTYVDVGWIVRPGGHGEMILERSRADA